MNKSIEAFLRGYYKFEVNGRVFYLYNKALAHRKYLSSLNLDVWFMGHHVTKGEIMLYTSWGINEKDIK